MHKTIGEFRKIDFKGATMKIGSYANNNSANEIYSPQQASASDQPTQGNGYEYGAESNGPAKFQSENNNLTTGGNNRFKRADDSSEDEPSANDIHHTSKKDGAGSDEDFAKKFRSQFADQEYRAPNRNSPPRPVGWNAESLATQDRTLRNNGYEFVGYVGQSSANATSRLQDGFKTGEPNNSEDPKAAWSGQYLSTDPNVAVGYAVNKTDGQAGALLRTYAPRNLVQSSFYRTPESLDAGNPSRYFGDGQGLAGRSITGPQNATNPEPETVVDRSITSQLLAIPSLYEPSPESYQLANPSAEQNIPGLNSSPPNYRELPPAAARNNNTSNEPDDNNINLPPVTISGAPHVWGKDEF